MTLDDFSKTMSERAALLADPSLRERLAVVAANTVIVLVKRRVFRDGIAQDGSLIGKYSTTEAWYPIFKPGVPKISPKGKPENSKAKKTFYSETGYSGYRARLGRQNSKVDLNLSGGTFNAVKIGVGEKGITGMGVITALARDIIEGNEARFDCVTVTPNEEERAAGRDAAKRELEFILGIG